MQTKHDTKTPFGLRRPKQIYGRIRPSLAVIGFWLLVTSVLSVATVLVLWDFRAKELAEVENDIDNLSRVLAEQTTRTLQAVDLVLVGTEEYLQSEEAGGFLKSGQSVNALLNARISGVPQIRSLFIVGADGAVANSALGSPVGLSVRDRDYFAVHKADSRRGLFISKPLQNRVDGKWTLFMSRRLNSPQGDFRGVIAVSIEIGYFEALYKLINPGEGSTISLFLLDGTLIAGAPFEDKSIGASFSHTALFRALEAEPDRTLLRTSGNAPRMFSYRQVGDFPLVVAVSISESSALGLWREQATHVAWGVLVVILLLALAAIALTREMGREEALAHSLQHSEARLHGIIDSAMDAIVTVDESQHVVFFNPAAEKMFGCSAAEALGAPLDRFLPERYRKSHRDYVQRFGETGQSSRAKGGHSEIVALRANGEEFFVDASISQIRSEGKKLYTAMLRDITARLERDEELRRSNQQLRELSASLQSVREEERTRIARELHDELGQQLTGLRMDLSWMATRLHDDQANIADKINSMKKLIDMTVGSVRRIASELRPLMLDDLGLVAAAHWLAEEFSKRTGIEVVLDLDADGIDIGDSVSSSVFRILQESLTNVARHAEAAQVRISLKLSGPQLILKVQDNGKGMPADTIDKARSFGLIGIRERVYMLGGQASITSMPAEGTTIEIAVPLMNPASGRAGQ